MNNSTEYCNLKSFQEEMRSVHGYLSLVVCIFGSISNILNICVLTTREMRIPTNFILTGLAVSDLLVMLEYLPFTSHVYLNPHALIEADYFSYPWAMYMYFHALFTQVCHFNSCCLTVMLAIWRYIALNKPQMNKIWCHPYRTKLAIFASAILCPFVCTPLFLGLSIKTIDRAIYPNGTLVGGRNLPNRTANITQKLHVLDLDNNYQNINFLIYSVVLKLIPCVLLTLLSVLLIKTLWDAKKRWKNLSNNSGVPLVKSMDQQRRDLEKDQQADRTTRMLLAVLLFFLLPEIPQATMGLLAVMLNENFLKNCYLAFGDLFDIMALLGSSINFILYCSMSAQFRTAFKKMFKLDSLGVLIMRCTCSRHNETDDNQLHNRTATCVILNGGGGGGEDANSHEKSTCGNLPEHQIRMDTNVSDGTAVRV